MTVLYFIGWLIFEWDLLANELTISDDVTPTGLAPGRDITGVFRSILLDEGTSSSSISIASLLLPEEMKRRKMFSDLGAVHMGKVIPVNENTFRLAK